MMRQYDDLELSILKINKSTNATPQIVRFHDCGSYKLNLLSKLSLELLFNTNNVHLMICVVLIVEGQGFDS